jgi:hypothetical protein
MNLFQLFRFTWAGCVSWLFGRKGNSESALVFRSFFSRTNFIRPPGDARRFFACERSLFSAIGNLWKGGAAAVHGHGPLHLHNSSYGAPVWRAYLHARTGHHFTGSSLVFDFRGGEGIGAKLRLTFALFFLYPLLRILCWNAASRLNALGLPGAFVSAANMRNRMRRGKVRKVYFTGPYDPEANYFSVSLMRAGIEVCLVVSGTPLSRFLDTMVADELLLTNPYQEEELHRFRETIKVTKHSVHPPLTYLSFIHEYKLKERQSPPCTIGIYTSGIWKRKEKGIFFDSQVEAKEKVIFSAVDEFLSGNKEVNVTVYLHPVEKKEEADYRKAVDHYLGWIGNRARFGFAPAAHRTDHHYHSTDLAVIPVSNTISERLFCGYKVLIVPYGGEFPFPGSSLYPVSASTKEEIVQKVKELLGIGTADYFARFGLDKYRYTAFNNI